MLEVAEQRLLCRRTSTLQHTTLMLEMAAVLLLCTCYQPMLLLANRLRRNRDQQEGVQHVEPCSLVKLAGLDAHLRRARWGW